MGFAIKETRATHMQVARKQIWVQKVSRAARLQIRNQAY